MENRPKNNFHNNFHYSRYNSTKVKPIVNQLNNINKELNNKKQDELLNTKINKNQKLLNDKEIHSNKINEINYGDDLNNNIINEIKNNENTINPVQEQINKLKAENEEIRKNVDKKGKLINDLKDRCNEQKSMINELINKIENIKKFIPENELRRDKKKQKEKDKLEEQLAIAAVEEQIIKDLYPNNSNQATMDKIFYGDNNSNKENIRVKDKILSIPQIYYKKNEYDNLECSICFDTFKDNELLKQLECKHIFHKECLSQWLINMNNCPFCNQPC